MTVANIRLVSREAKESTAEITNEEAKEEEGATAPTAIDETEEERGGNQWCTVHGAVGPSSPFILLGLGRQIERGAGAGAGGEIGTMGGDGAMQDTDIL